MTTASDGLVLPPNAGKVLSAGGLRIVFKAAGQHTPIGATVVEITYPPGFDAGGAHLHRIQAEMAYIIAGELEWRVGDRTVQAGSGTFVSIPPGVVHTLVNRGSAPATQLVVASPAGVLDRYLEEIVELLSKGGPLDIAALAAIRERHDTVQVE